MAIKLKLIPYVYLTLSHIFTSWSTAEGYFKDALKRLQAIERQPNITEKWEPLLNNLGHTSRKLK